MASETLADPVFAVTSPAFGMETMIPTEYTDDGTGLSPPLGWHTVPDGTKSFALLVIDPDTKMGDMVHWVAYDIPATVAGLDSGADIQSLGGILGTNGKGTTAWTPPAPPPGDPAHRYLFHLFAIDRPSLSLPPGATRDQVEDAASNYTLSMAVLVGLYQR